MNFLLGISKKYHVGYLIPYGVQKDGETSL